MRLFHKVHHLNREETVENIDAVVILIRNPNGHFCFIKGEEHAVHRAFLEGCLRWPSVIDWEESTKRAIQNVLEPRLSRASQKILFVSHELVSGEYKVPDYTGSADFDITEIDGADSSSSFSIKDVDDALSFLWVDGKVLVGADGSGMEKTELMFFGARVLFGEKVSEDLREVIYGFREVEFEDGAKFSFDYSEIAQKMLRAFRANKGVKGGIVLTAETWAALAEELAKKGEIRPSLN